MQFEYREIMLHAICRDETAYPHPCIYCQMERAGESTEVRYVPIPIESPDNSNISAAVSLEDIFGVMSECASLHPDLDDEYEPGSNDVSYIRTHERVFATDYDACIFGTIRSWGVWCSWNFGQQWRLLLHSRRFCAGQRRSQ